MVDPRFAHTEQRYDRLKAELTVGHITGEVFERALWDAMFESDGRLWMLGANSRRWYASDGAGGWVQTSPPSTPGAPPQQAAASPKPSTARRLLGIVVLIAVAAFALFSFRSGYDAWTAGDRAGGAVAVGFGALLAGTIVAGLLASAKR
jgi:hypothetical protein